MIFPPNCAGCGEWGSKYCADCVAKTRIIKDPICIVCGVPDSSLSAAVCSACSGQKIFFEAARSWAEFETPLKEAIHRLKYHNDIGLANNLSDYLVKLYESNKWEVDLIAAVPLEKKRLRERGYNQAAVLAKSFAAKVELEYNQQAITRKKSTLSQVGLTRKQRVENVKDALFAKHDIVWKKTILLVDDVITTGATLNSCSETLLNYGAEKIYGLTLARSVHL